MSENNMQFKAPAVPLSGTAAAVVGIIGSIMLAAVAFIPAPWNVLVGLVGFLACALAGLAARPPEILAGKPLLQGTALTIATAVGALLQQMVLPALPPGWIQSVAYAVLGVLAWLTGRALPALGSQPIGGVVVEPMTKAEALSEFRKGPPAS